MKCHYKSMADAHIYDKALDYLKINASIKILDVPT